MIVASIQIHSLDLIWALIWLLVYCWTGRIVICFWEKKCSSCKRKDCVSLQTRALFEVKTHLSLDIEMRLLSVAKENLIQSGDTALTWNRDAALERYEKRTWFKVETQHSLGAETQLSNVMKCGALLVWRRDFCGNHQEFILIIFFDVESMFKRTFFETIFHKVSIDATIPYSRYLLKSV